MYPVTDLYKEMINNNDRDFTCDIKIEHSQGTLNLTDVDLSQGSLIYSESSQTGDEFTIGSTIASDISFTIFKKPEYADIQFMGATVFVTIGLFVQEGSEHFLQPSQPSRMKGFDDKWEYVPLGRFNIDDVNIQSNTIGLKAMDNMINLDIPYSLSKLSYPANLYQIYTNICSVGDISIGTLNFPNKDYIVTERPSDELTFRDVLGYVAELSGTFAKCDRSGRLELRWYEPTDLVIKPSIRYDFTPSDDVVQIKGIMASTEDTTYIAGSEDYAIDLSENPLLQDEYETVLANIYINVMDISFTPYTSSFKGNPAIQAGDMIVQVDKNGKEYNTLVTKMVYKYRSKGSLEAKGLPDISKGYKGSTNKKLAEIRRKIDIEVGDKITDLEQSILEATELITGELGGYVLKRENELLIMDNPDPDLAVKVWRWNLGGLGYSNTGVNGTYELAMTMNGAINANFITTGLLSANLVQTGLLTSSDDSTWINLNDGTFNFKNLLKYENGQLRLNSPDIPDDVDLSGVEQEITDIKNLKTNTLKGGIVTVDNNKVRVEHPGGQYSEMRTDGFVRKWQYGEAKYLNDILREAYTTEYYPDAPSLWEPSQITVPLPQSFRGRTESDIKITLSMNDINFWGSGLDRRGEVDYVNTINQVRLEVVPNSIRLNTTSPYFKVEAWQLSSYEYSNGRSRTDFNSFNFVVTVIGK